MHAHIYEHRCSRPPSLFLMDVAVGQAAEEDVAAVLELVGRIVELDADVDDDVDECQVAHTHTLSLYH